MNLKEAEKVIRNLPKSVIWLAVDANLEMYCYYKEPSLLEATPDEWMASGPCKYVGAYTGDLHWKDTLVRIE